MIQWFLRMAALWALATQNFGGALPVTDTWQSANRTPNRILGSSNISRLSSQAPIPPGVSHTNGHGDLAPACSSVSPIRVPALLAALQTHFLYHLLTLEPTLAYVPPLALSMLLTPPHTHVLPVCLPVRPLSLDFLLLHSSPCPSLNLLTEEIPGDSWPPVCGNMSIIKFCFLLKRSRM